MDGLKLDIVPTSDTFVYLEERKSYHFERENETVMMEQVSSNCFKVNATLGTKFKNNLSRHLVVSLTDIEEKYFPESVTAYFTSEDNVYGIFNQEWLDGQAFDQSVKLGHRVDVILKPQECKYLDNDLQCSHETFFEQWMKYFESANHTNCLKNCAPYSFLVSDDISICPWEDFDDTLQRQCVWLAFYETYENAKSTFKRPCHILEYQGKETYAKKDQEYQFRLTYKFAPPEMTIEHQEHLLFDVFGLIGNVGGTLGMCIGFSFIGMGSSILDFIKNWVLASY